MSDKADNRSRASTPRLPTTPTETANDSDSDQRRRSITHHLLEIVRSYAAPRSRSDSEGSGDNDSSRLSPFPSPGLMVGSAPSTSRASSPRSHVMRVTVYDPDSQPNGLHLDTILVSGNQYEAIRQGNVRLEGRAIRPLEEGETAVPLCLCDKTHCISSHYPLLPSDFQDHYQLTDDRASVRFDPDKESLVEVDHEGSEYTGTELKGKRVDGRKIFKWLEIPSPEGQWPKQCAEPGGEKSGLCVTCEYWHKTSTLNMPRPEFLGAPAPNWLLKRERLVPMTSIVRDTQRDEQPVSSGSK